MAENEEVLEGEVLTGNAIVLYESPEDLEQVLAQFTKKQKEFLIFVAMGDSPEEAREAVGIVWKTYKNWQDNAEFSWALQLVKAKAGAELARKAGQLFLAGYHPKVLRDIGVMATKDWGECKTSYEYQAKLKCIDILQRSQGFSGPSVGTVNVNWTQNITKLLEED